MSDRKQSTARVFQVIADANKMITSGTSWGTDIVKRLSSFTRLDEAEFETLDMQEDIEDILLLVQHELKNKAVVERLYGLLPPISCKSRQLNQVFPNLIINTVQAIEDHDTISITTFAEKNIACVRISHTGVGIPPEYLQENFDPGFPTKDVGVDTGLDLSICYQILETYRGDMLAESEVGKGTNFMAVLSMQLKESDYRD